MSLVLDDTIAAIATAPGAAGLAVVRRERRRRARGRRSRCSAVARHWRRAASHTLHHGWAMDGAERGVDEVIAAVFRAPRSYTREDVVELSCHGGALPSRRVLAALLARRRPARAVPGEFTLRAFLNGRLDLAQAEAVADVIARRDRRRARPGARAARRRAVAAARRVVGGAGRCARRSRGAGRLRRGRGWHRGARRTWRRRSATWRRRSARCSRGADFARARARRGACAAGRPAQRGKVVAVQRAARRIARDRHRRCRAPRATA